jgi:hypothetical protein
LRSGPFLARFIVFQKPDKLAAAANNCARQRTLEGSNGTAGSG